MNHRAALFLCFRVGTAEADIELCRALYPPSKVLKVIEVLKIFTNGYASIGKALNLKVLWSRVKELILASEVEAF